MHVELIFEADASDYCIGGFLQQDQGNGLQPIVYHSKKLTGGPHNYTTHEYKLFAIVVSIKKWWP